MKHTVASDNFCTTNDCEFVLLAKFAKLKWQSLSLDY